MLAFHEEELNKLAGLEIGDLVYTIITEWTLLYFFISGLPKWKIKIRISTGLKNWYTWNDREFVTNFPFFSAS